jgi:predicted secreted protein
MSTPNVTVGGDILVKVGGVTVAGQRGASLTRSVTQVSTASKLTKGWTRGRPTIKEWSASAPGLWAADGTDYLGTQALFDVRIGGTWTPLQGRKNLSVTLALGTIPAVYGDVSPDRYLKADRRTVTFAVSGDEVQADTALAALKTAYEGRTQVEVRFTVGTTVVSGMANVMNDTISANDGEMVGYDFSIECIDAATVTSAGAAAGISQLMTAYMAGTEVAVVFDPDAGSGAIVGRTRYAGNGLPVNIQISADSEAEVSYSLQVDGSGPLNRTTVSA